MQKECSNQSKTFKSNHENELIEKFAGFIKDYSLTADLKKMILAFLASLNFIKTLKNLTSNKRQFLNCTILLTTFFKVLFKGTLVV